MLARPAGPLVRKALETVLQSDTFRRSERSRDLLAYLVEQEQAGHSAKLKGFSIAIDVFGKDSEFDSSTDAVVRVQAGRLRELLDTYYAGEGKAEPLRITIPRGSYVPVYEGRRDDPALTADEAASAETPVEPSPIATPSSRPRRLWTLGAAALAAITLLSAMALQHVLRDAHRPESPAAMRTAAIEALAAQPDALPQIKISATSANADVRRISPMLRTALSGFDTVKVVARDDSPGDASVPDALRFRLELSPGAEDGSVLVDVEEAETGVMLTSRVLDPQDLAADEITDTVAELATDIAPVNGVIYHHLEKAGLQSGLVSCLLKAEQFYAEQQGDRLETAFRCLEGLEAAGVRSPLVYAELASLELQAVTGGYDYPPDATRQKALALARQGIQIGAASPYAHRAFGYMQTRNGLDEESLRWMKKAYELNPYDLSMAASYGYALVFAGRYADGTPLLARAVDAISAHPTWWDFGLFLGLYMTNDFPRAQAASSALVANDASHYLAARLIVADRTGDIRTAVKLIEEIRQSYPRFAANPRIAFTTRNYPEDMTDRLSNDLARAGLVPPGQ